MITILRNCSKYKISKFLRSQEVSKLLAGFGFLHFVFSNPGSVSSSKTWKQIVFTFVLQQWNFAIHFLNVT